MFPNYRRSFNDLFFKNRKFRDYYKKLNPKLFDVTLRDGLQGLTKQEQEKYTFTEKKNLYDKIISIQQPQQIEVGSIVSENVLPIFKDTKQFTKYIFENPDLNRDYFLLVPNVQKLKTAIMATPIRNFSFITSVSNSFQIKNTKMNLEESDKNINNMLDKLEEYSIKQNVKLYVSCINKCPIEGKIDNDFIVNRILKLSMMNIDIICLSDTCGTLEFEDFDYIIETCLYFGLQPSRISLHLHVKPDREDVIESIIHKAFDYKIVNFDVSMLDIGGCSVTMSKENLAPNLSYELYYKALSKYILKNSNI
jgi:isopropylmalate/homocitrate/citramalate synthase